VEAEKAGTAKQPSLADLVVRNFMILEKAQRLKTV
jgi:hypothetical protein